VNPFLQASGVNVYETDLAEIILQLGDEDPSHIVVPALHINRSQVREIFARTMGLNNLSDDPKELTNAARTYLRQKFLTVPTAISGANFLVAETGTVAVVESEGNGRMCLTLPQTMISLVGIEKVLPRFQDLEVMLQLLARSATGERMNPYTSLWTGVTPGDGPQKFHVVLLDNGRSSILAKEKERQTLKCIRCAACMNACPVYRQTGGHAYGSVYPGPIGAILTPQLMQMKYAQTLPFASSLCGACYEVCPVKINIPEVLLELRSQVVNQERKQAGRVFDLMYLGLRIANLIFATAWGFHAAQRMDASACASSLAKTAGFTRCPAWALSGPRPAICAAFLNKPSTSGGPRVPRRENEAARRIPPTDSRPHPRSHTRRSRGCIATRRCLCGSASHLHPSQLFIHVRPHQLMIHRLREYDAEVVESTPADLPAAITASLRPAAGIYLLRRPELRTNGWSRQRGRSPD